MIHLPWHRKLKPTKKRLFKLFERRTKMIWTQFFVSLTDITLYIITVTLNLRNLLTRNGETKPLWTIYLNSPQKCIILWIWRSVGRVYLWHDHKWCEWTDFGQTNLNMHTSGIQKNLILIYLIKIRQSTMLSPKAKQKSGYQGKYRYSKNARIILLFDSAHHSSNLVMSME